MKTKTASAVAVAILLTLILVHLVACSVASQEVSYNFACEKYSLPNGWNSLGSILANVGGTLYSFDDRQADGMIKLTRFDPGQDEADYLTYTYEFGKEYIVCSAYDNDSSIWLLMGSDSGNLLKRINIDGEYMDEIDMSAWQDTGFWSKLVVKPSGGGEELFYAISYENLYCFDHEGNKKYDIQISGLSDIVIDTEGNCYVLYESAGGQKLAIVNDSGKTETVMTLSKQYSGLMNLGINGVKFFMYNSTGGYGIDVSSKKEIELFTWTDLGVISNDISSITASGDGRIIYYHENTVCVLTEVSGLSGDDTTQVISEKTKTTLVLAGYDISYDILQQVSVFNANTSDYTIKVEDYVESGLIKLSAELIAGNVPDILVLDNLPAGQYSSIGLLEDLYPYIDRDAELDRSDFYLFDLIENSGKLYEAVPAFNINTIIASSANVGNNASWTFDAMFKIIDEKGVDAFADVTRDFFLVYFLNNTLDTYVDWQTGTANFEGEDFLSLLKLCKELPEDLNEQELSELQDGAVGGSVVKLREGQSVFLLDIIENFLAPQAFRLLFNGDYTYIGFPGTTGGGSSAIFTTSIALCSQSMNKDAAWEFVRIFLTDEYQTPDSFMRYWGSFPTNKTAMQNMITDEQLVETYEEDGVEKTKPKLGSTYGISGVLYAAKDEEIEEILALIDSLENVYRVDESITAIVIEEVSDYFNGSKTVAETAKIIQNRVQTYVSEQS